MGPIPLPVLLLALGGLGWFLFKGKGDAPIDRGAAMAKLADILYRVIGKLGFTSEETASVPALARMLGMPKTAEAYSKGGSLPNDERWPGTNLSVSAYMYEYTQKRKPGAKPAAKKPAPAAKKYNDEIPVAPFEDPRKVRAQALAAEKSGNAAAAKIYHAKADSLNTLIRAAKAKNAAVSNVKAAGKALVSLLK